MQGLLNLTRPAPHVDTGHAHLQTTCLRDCASSQPAARGAVSWTGWPWSPDHRAAQLAAWGLHSRLGQQADLKRVRPFGAYCGGVSEGLSHEGAPGRAVWVSAGAGVLAPRRQHRKVAERCACERRVRPSLRGDAWGGLPGRDADKGLGGNAARLTRGPVW